MINKIVLITRDAEAANNSKKTLKKQGYGIVSLPIVETKFLDVKVELSNYNLVIFTSINALKSLGDKILIPEELEAYLIGENSEIYAKNLGFKKVRRFKNSKKLLDDLLKVSPNNQRILYLRGKKISRDIKGVLEFEGYIVDETINYEMNFLEITKQDLQNALNKVDIIKFYSLENAKRFLFLIDKYQLKELFSQKKIISISDRIAKIF